MKRFLTVLLSREFHATALKQVWNLNGVFLMMASITGRNGRSKFIKILGIRGPDSQDSHWTIATSPTSHERFQVIERRDVFANPLWGMRHLSMKFWLRARTLSLASARSLDRIAGEGAENRTPTSRESLGTRDGDVVSGETRKLSDGTIARRASERLLCSPLVLVWHCTCVSLFVRVLN